MEIRPISGRVLLVRDSTIAPPKGPRASEQGIRRPWFFPQMSSASCRETPHILRDHGMEMRPFLSRICLVRDSEIALPKGPRASESGIRRLWFFRWMEPTQKQDLRKILKFELAGLKFLGHQSFTASEYSVSADYSTRCHFQVPDEQGVRWLELRGEVQHSSKLIRNSLGGMCYKGAGFRARAFYNFRRVAGDFRPWSSL